MQSTNLQNNISKFKSWLTQPLGKYLLNFEKNVLESTLKYLKINDSIIIGQPNFLDCLSQLQIKNKIYLSQFPEKNNNLPTICSREDKLPIATEIIELVYLPHTLELVNNPHEVLRETYRILKPEGYLIITSFNSFSLWGILRMLLKFTKKSPWNGTFSNTIKITDWLSLLGYNVTATKYFLNNLPFNNDKYLSKTKFLDIISSKLNLPFCSSFAVIAKKRTSTLTPITPKWSNRTAVINDKNLTEPTCFK